MNEKHWKALAEVQAEQGDRVSAYLLSRTRTFDSESDYTRSEGAMLEAIGRRMQGLDRD